MRLSHGLGLRVSFCLQEVDDTLFEVALHDDFSIFGTSAYSTFTFQQFAQFFQIIVGAHETCDKSDDFAKQKEIARLRRELRDAQDALDVLKKAINILWEGRKWK